MSGTKHPKRDEGVKFDSGKPRVALIMSKAILEVAKVGTFGAEKYGDHNYRKGLKWSRLADATLRHFLAYLTGQRIDAESGLSHLAHVAWNVLTMLEFEIEGVGEDDLWRGYVKPTPNPVGGKKEEENEVIEFLDEFAHKVDTGD